MTASEEQRLRTAISRLFEANERLAELSGRTGRQVLGPSCTTADITGLERRYGLELPPSYKAFLLLHDGWTGFDAGADLLSIESMSDQGIRERIEEWRYLEETEGNPGAAHAFVIAAARLTTYLVYLDVHSRRVDGEMDVVEYDNAELDRYLDFVSLLESQEKVTCRLIAKRQAS